MRFCKYCGFQIDDSTNFCPQCGKALFSQKPHAPMQNNQPSVSTASKPTDSLSWLKNPIAWVCVAVLVVVVVLICFSGSNKCKYGSCRNTAVSGFDYCYSHKCAVSNCNDSYYSSSNYCFSHYLLYDDDAASSSNHVPSYQLKISNVEVYSSRNYTYAEGTITNNSDSTIKFVEIKGAFKDRYGTVVDTDWTYAVGSEGLAPGESCKWKLFVDADSNITDCDISILDYDY